MAKGVELASAYISLSVSTDGVPEQVSKAFRGVDKVGATAGRDLGRRMAGEVSGALGQAGKESGGRFTDRFGAELRGGGRRAAAGFTGDLEQQSDRAGRSAGQQWARSFERSANPDIDLNVRSVGGAAGSDAGDEFMSGFGGAVAGLGSKAGPIGAGLAAAGVLALSAGKVLGGQVLAGMQQELGRDQIQARLGVDPVTITKIDKASRDAFFNNFGASLQENMETATSAIQSGLIDATSSQRDVQKVIEQLNTVSTVLGEDIPAVSRSATQAIRTGMAGNATEAFDLLVKAQQNGLNTSGDLLDTLNEYSTQFRKLGLDGPQAMALLSQAVKGGARDTDIAADALKEFSIRAVDGSKTSREAFTTLGLDADVMTQKFATGGDSARQGLDQIFDGLRSIQDPAERSRVAVQLFGTQAEDLGGALDKFDLTTAVTEFGKVEQASQQAANTMSSNALNEWQTAKNHIVGYIGEIQRSLGDMFGGFATIFPTMLNDLADPSRVDERWRLPGMIPGGTPGTPLAPMDILGGTGSNAPYNPLTAPLGATGTGGLTPAAAQIKQTYESQGVTGIGGYNANVDQPWDEHQTGQAVDIPVGNYGRGMQIVQEQLKNPNVAYVIFGQKMFHADGRVVPMEDRGSPTENHMDHVHVRTNKATGGAIHGPGTGTSDSIPAYLSNGEHVLTARDVASMGGQAGVYAFRNALHRKNGGEIALTVPWGVDPKGGPDGEPSAGPFGPWWDMDWMPPENPEEVGPGKGKWWYRGPTKGKGRFRFPPIGDKPGMRKPLPGMPTPNIDDRIKFWGFAEGGAVGAAQGLGAGIDEEKWKQLLAQNPGMSAAQVAQQAMNAQHGTQQGAPPGPPNSGRTEGYIPAAAGNIAPVGEGGLSNFLDLGESFVHNLIDTGAQAASMAASAAAAAGSGGAGAAAGPAASTAIQMGAEAGKRLVSYGYDLAGIWGEALVEQAFPFGAPRWLGSANPMAFMPQGIPGGEKKEPGTMGAAAQSIQSWAQPGNPAMANGTAQQGAQAALQADPGVGQQTPPQSVAGGTPPVNPMVPSTWLPHAGIFDNGGVLPPQSFGINLSKRPEYVFTQRQMRDLAKTALPAASQTAKGEVHFHAQNNDEMWRRYQWEQRRQARRYNGRP